MSADNWGVCPRCYEKDPDAAKKEQHLREDWEIGIDAICDKEFYVIYNANCRTCGYKFHHAYAENV